MRPGESRDLYNRRIIMADLSINRSVPTDHTAAWDWDSKHVAQAYNDDTGTVGYKDGGTSINDIIESGTVLIAAGPADLDLASKNGGIRIVPIGLIESAQISMNKPLSRIFEIGSRLSYIIPGRSVGGIGISRVFFDGPSLLKALYMGEVVADSSDGANKFAKFASTSGEDAGAKQFENIGSGNLAVNLASKFFDHPVGLAFYFRDAENSDVSQIYFEGCNVGSYSLGISANMNVLTESVNIEFVRCRPIVTQASTLGRTSTGIADLNIVSAMTEDLSA